ncbi:hypothetical protein QFC22_000898 [Naganishia vaughanmartiniae]|uniref:Uncharacterized protein n=1 Tax=Naganishia vaughanmartiniae TaxID=1424756 RepID=A0ACC2XJB7_9TREE|nr:hypothetical protein QFC22_000898 [Naganishia vaughanmartiniae]
MSNVPKAVYVPRAKREALAKEAELQPTSADLNSGVVAGAVNITDEETQDWSYARKWFFERSETFKRLQNVKKQFGEDPRVENLFNQQRANSTQNAPVSRRFADQFYQCMQDIDDTAGSVLCKDAESPVRNYLDLGCSPGGFSSWVMDQHPRSRGLGVTLHPDRGGLPMVSMPQGDYDIQYGDLTELQRTTDLIEQRFGSDEQGVIDLASAAAIYRDTETAQPRSRNKDDEPSAPPGARVILSLSQISLVLNHLQAGGHFVFVLSNKPDPATVQTLVLLRRLFRRILPCKGKTLHGVRSSFYLFCEGFDRQAFVDNSISKLLSSTIETMRQTARMIIEEEESQNIEDVLQRLGIEDNKNKEYFAADMIWLPEYNDQRTLLEEEGDFVEQFFKKLWDGQVRSIEEKIVNLDHQNHSHRNGKPGWSAKKTPSFGEHARGNPFSNSAHDQPAVLVADTWRKKNAQATAASVHQGASHSSIRQISSSPAAEDGWQVAKGKGHQQKSTDQTPADGRQRTIPLQRKDPAVRASSAFTQDQGAFGNSWRK